MPNKRKGRALMQSSKVTVVLMHCKIMNYEADLKQPLSRLRTEERVLQQVWLTPRNRRHLSKHKDIDDHNFVKHAFSDLILLKIMIDSAKMDFFFATVTGTCISSNFFVFLLCFFFSLYKKKQCFQICIKVGHNRDHLQSLTTNNSFFPFLIAIL